MKAEAVAPRARDVRVELPADDLAIEQLDAAARERIAHVWTDRAHNELRTSTVFANLHRALVAARAAPPVIRLAALAVSDEVRHADICIEVASRYAGKEVDYPAVEPILEPHFAGCGDVTNRHLFTVMQCCINETIAVSYLRTCFDRAKGALVRAAVRAILEDEIDHSRLGWAHLGSQRVSEEMRLIVADAMPQLLTMVHAVWIADEGGHHDAAPAGHGALAMADVHEVVRATVRDVVIPGLEHVRVDAAGARTWLAKH